MLLFFPKSALLNLGCGLSTDAAYTWTFTVLCRVLKGLKGVINVDLGKVSTGLPTVNFD